MNKSRQRFSISKCKCWALQLYLQRCDIRKQCSCRAGWEHTVREDWMAIFTALEKGFASVTVAVRLRNAFGPKLGFRATEWLVLSRYPEVFPEDCESWPCRNLGSYCYVQRSDLGWQLWWLQLNNPQKTVPYSHTVPHTTKRTLQLICHIAYESHSCRPMRLPIALA